MIIYIKQFYITLTKQLFNSYKTLIPHLLLNMNNENKQDIIDGFSNFINSKNKIDRKASNYGIGIPKRYNEKLINITCTILPQEFNKTLFSLVGFELTIENVTRKLSINEMDQLYLFIKEHKEINNINYLKSYKDITIMDGSSYYLEINWNSIFIVSEGNNEIQECIYSLINFCKKL